MRIDQLPRDFLVEVARWLDPKSLLSFKWCTDRMVTRFGSHSILPEFRLGPTDQFRLSALPNIAGVGLLSLTIHLDAKNDLEQVQRGKWLQALPKTLEEIDFAFPTCQSIWFEPDLENRVPWHFKYSAIDLEHSYAPISVSNLLPQLRKLRLQETSIEGGRTLPVWADDWNEGEGKVEVKWLPMMSALFAATLPHGLACLDVSIMSSADLLFLPPQLSSLTLSNSPRTNNDSIDFRTLPETLFRNATALDVGPFGGNFFSSLTHFQQLASLRLGKFSGSPTQLNSLPSTLIELNLHLTNQCSFADVARLPPFLLTLTLTTEGAGAVEINSCWPLLPTRLTELNITFLCELDAATDLENLRRFPPALTRLVLNVLGSDTFIQYGNYHILFTLQSFDWVPTERLKFFAIFFPMSMDYPWNSEICRWVEEIASSVSNLEVKIDLADVHVRAKNGRFENNSVHFHEYDEEMGWREPENIYDDADHSWPTSADLTESATAPEHPFIPEHSRHILIADPYSYGPSDSPHDWLPNRHSFAALALQWTKTGRNAPPSPAELVLDSTRWLHTAQPPSALVTSITLTLSQQEHQQHNSTALHLRSLADYRSLTSLTLHRSFDMTSFHWQTLLEESIGGKVLYECLPRSLRQLSVPGDLPSTFWGALASCKPESRVMLKSLRIDHYTSTTTLKALLPLAGSLTSLFVPVLRVYPDDLIFARLPRTLTSLDDQHILAALLPKLKRLNERKLPSKENPKVLVYQPRQPYETLEDDILRNEVNMSMYPPSLTEVLISPWSERCSQLLGPNLTILKIGCFALPQLVSIGEWTQFALPPSPKASPHLGTLPTSLTRIEFLVGHNLPTFNQLVASVPTSVKQLVIAGINVDEQLAAHLPRHLERLEMPQTQLRAKAVINALPQDHLSCLTVSNMVSQLVSRLPPRLTRLHTQIVWLDPNPSTAFTSAIAGLKRLPLEHVSTVTPQERTLFMMHCSHQIESFLQMKLD